ncbi:MAG: CbiX/SirB N-terminal domain-containing protein [Pseudomonadota bacterium]
MSNKKPSKKTNASNTKKEAIILLGHGSRVPDAARNMKKTAERLKEKHGYAMVKICFMSRLGPHFPKVFEYCVSMGAAKVLVIPYFLHMGLHLLLDIPKMMQQEGQKYPQVELVLGKGLGYDELLVDLVHSCIQKSQHEKDVRDIILPPEEKFPIPQGQYEFVPMTPEEAAKYKRKPHG